MFFVEVYNLKTFIITFLFIFSVVACKQESVQTEEATSSSLDGGNLSGDTVLKPDPNNGKAVHDVLEGEDAEAMIQLFEESADLEEIISAGDGDALVRCVLDEDKVLASRVTVDHVRAKVEIVADFLTTEDIWELCDRELEILSKI